MWMTFVRIVKVKKVVLLDFYNLIRSETDQSMKAAGNVGSVFLSFKGRLSFTGTVCKKSLGLCKQCAEE